MLRPGLISRHGGSYTPPAGTPFQDAVLALNPSRYWPDASAFPIANAGTFGADDLDANGATANVTGPLVEGDSKAFSTDGVDDGPSPGTVDLSGTSAISFMFWMDWDVADALHGTGNVDNPQIASFGNPAAVGQPAFHVRANGVNTGKWRIDNYQNVKEFDRSVSSEGWRFYLIVIDHTQAADDEIKVYRDGSAVTLSSVSNTDQSGAFGNQTLYLGRDFFGRYATAKFAHVALFTTALSSTNAADLYAAGT